VGMVCSRKKGFKMIKTIPCNFCRNFVQVSEFDKWVKCNNCGGIMELKK
jgi:hypothetical protein